MSKNTLHKGDDDDDDNNNNNNFPKPSLSLRHQESCLEHYYCFVFRRTWIRISTHSLASLTVGCRGFIQSFKTSTDIVPQLPSLPRSFSTPNRLWITAKENL